MHCSVAVIIFTLLWTHLQNFYIFSLDFIRFFIAFLPKSKCLLILWLQSPSAVILEPKKIKSVTASTFSPSICHKVMGLDAMILVFWLLSFRPAFSLFPFALIKKKKKKKKFSSYSLLSAIRVVSSAYLRLFLFLPEILIPVCDSSSLTFNMMYSAYKLNKQGANRQPWCTPYPFEPVHCSMSVSNCCFLTCIQVSKEIGKVVWSSHFFKNFPVCCDPYSQRC